MPGFGSDYRTFTHAVQFYLDEHFLVHMTGELVTSAFRCGSAAVLIATAGHHKAFERYLIEKGFDVASQIRQGIYVAIDADETLRQCVIGGKVDLPYLTKCLSEILSSAKAAAANQSSEVFVFGELVALLCAQRQYETALVVEKMWDALIQKIPCSLLCAYPIHQFTDKEIQPFFPRICSAHATVIPPDAYPNTESERNIMELVAASYHRHL